MPLNIRSFFINQAIAEREGLPRDQASRLVSSAASSAPA